MRKYIENRKRCQNGKQHGGERLKQQPLKEVATRANQRINELIHKGDTKSLKGNKAHRGTKIARDSVSYLLAHEIRTDHKQECHKANRIRRSQIIDKTSNKACGVSIICKMKQITARTAMLRVFLFLSETCMHPP